MSNGIRARIALITPIEDNIPVQVSAYKAWMPRYGSVAIAQAIKNAGYEIRHYCEHSGSVIDWDFVYSCDYVCFSLMTFCAYRGYKQADQVRENSKAIIIFGGCHATVAPEDSLNHCDFIVRNEGEAATLELLDALENNRDTTDIKGISFRDDSGLFHHNPNHEFMHNLDQPVDISIIDGYPKNHLGRFLWEAITRCQIPKISLPVAQSSRGCVHKCKFCMVKYELGSEYRERSPDVVLDEVDRAFNFLGSRTIFFVDNDFTHNTDHALSILQPLISKYDGHFNLYIFSRVELARKPRLLDALSKIDNVYIGVGFESTNDTTLSQFSKGQTQGDFEKNVQILHKHGLNIHGLFIFGADADTETSLTRTVNFALESKLYTVGFSALYDIPGKEKTTGIPQIIPDHRFIHRDWRLFTGHFVVFFPKHIRPSQLQRKIIDGQKSFFRKNKKTFYQYFPVFASSEPYCRYLEEQEKGLYDSNDNLIEDRLPNRTFKDLPDFVHIKPSHWVKTKEITEFLVRNACRKTAWKMLIRNFKRFDQSKGNSSDPGSVQI